MASKTGGVRGAVGLSSTSTTSSSSSSSTSQRRPSASSLSSTLHTAPASSPLSKEEAELQAKKAALLSPLNRKDRPSLTSSVSGVDDDDEKLAAEVLNLNLGELDITTDEINFDGVDDDLIKFQQDAIVKEALDKGVDLRQYSRQIEQDLSRYEQVSVDDYLSSADNLSSLHSQIKNCDGILEEMQKMLSKFQGNLGAISSEIRTLQEKSMQMNTKLKNRKSAEAMLSKFIDGLNITDELTNTIMDAEFNDTYVQALMILDKKLKFLTSNIANQSRAGQELAPLLDKLKQKAVSRVRNYLLEKISQLKKPKTNIAIKQNLLIKHKYLYHFLQLHAKQSSIETSSSQPNYSQNTVSTPNSAGQGNQAFSIGSADVGFEIRESYTDTMSKIYFNRYKRYLADTKKVQLEHTVGKNDLLGVEESKGGADLMSSVLGAMIGSSSVSKKNSTQLSAIFNLSNRETILLEVVDKDNVLIPHIADKQGKKFNFERIWKSAQHLLIDTAIAEAEFLNQFFLDDWQPPSHGHGGILSSREEDEKKNKSKEDERKGILNSGGGSTGGSNNSNSNTNNSGGNSGANKIHSGEDQTLFSVVFSKTLTLFHETLNDYVVNCYDTLSLLLLIRILSQNNHTMQQRGMHYLDSYFDRMNMTLWPRFKSTFDAHVESIMKYPFIEPKKSSLAKPHFIVSRYADFCAAILRLNKGYNDDILTSNLRRIRYEIDKLLTRSAARITKPKEQIIFLINHYHSILRVLTTIGTTTPGLAEMSGGSSLLVDSEDAAMFTQLAAGQHSLFVEEELNERFGKLIKFVMDTETLLSSSQSVAEAESKIDLNVVDTLVKSFAKSWRDGIDQIVQSCQTHFGGSPASSSSAASVSSPTAAGSSSSSGAEDNDLSTEILKQVLVQLVLYYKRFEAIIKQHVRGRNFVKDLVPIPTIMFEIKKFANTGVRTKDDG